MVCSSDPAHVYLTCTGTRDGDFETTTPRFNFPPRTTFSNGSFEVVDDDVYEYDELIMATFEFDRTVVRRFTTTKGHPNVTFILIEDDDCE